VQFLTRTSIEKIIRRTFQAVAKAPTLNTKFNFLRFSVPDAHHLRLFSKLPHAMPSLCISPAEDRVRKSCRHHRSPNSASSSAHEDSPHPGVKSHLTRIISGLSYLMTLGAYPAVAIDSIRC